MRVKKPFVFCLFVLLGIFLSVTSGADEKLPQIYFHVPKMLFQPLGPVGAAKKELIQAQNQLRKEAKKMDADAVVGVTCQSGGLKRVGLTWSRYQPYCRGLAVKFLDKEETVTKNKDKLNEEEK